MAEIALGLLNCSRKGILKLEVPRVSTLIKILQDGEVAQNCKEGDTTATYDIVGAIQEAHAICQTDCPFIKRLD